MIGRGSFLVPKCDGLGLHCGVSELEGEGPRKRVVDRYCVLPVGEVDARWRGKPGDGGTIMLPEFRDST